MAGGSKALGALGDTTPCCPLLRLEGQEEPCSIRTFPAWRNPLPGICQGGTPHHLAARVRGLALAGSPTGTPKCSLSHPWHSDTTPACRRRDMARWPRSRGLGSIGQGCCHTASGVRDLLHTEPVLFPLQSPFSSSSLCPDPDVSVSVVLICLRA